MTASVQPKAEKYNLRRTKKQHWKRFVTFLAAIVVFCTTYALIMPAITWEKSLICEQEEHQHSEECYKILEIPAEKKFICEKAEHIHTVECITEVRELSCSKAECEAHHHDDSCYTEKSYLACTAEDPEHIHDDSCFAVRTVLACGLEETDGHSHSDECYTVKTVYTCGMEEHSHDDGCYTETEAHTERILVCEKEEHIHDTNCYDAPPAVAEDPYFCGLIAHTHDENCYFEDGTLKCTIEEHVHTADCEIDPDAVTEIEAEEIQAEETTGEDSLECAITTINAFSSDGAEVIITGLLPEGAEAKIDAVTLSEEDLIAYFGEAKAAAMKDFVAYDIKIMVGDEEWQPDESVSVVVKEPAITVEKDENFAVAHVDGETEEVSDVEAVIDENGEVSFEAEGFSIYIFYTFTVDFHFGETTFSIDGRTNILLSELFEELGIEFSAADAVNVVFSDDSLLAVEQLEGDWLLTSLEAFSTYETLSIEFADGETLIIDVADAQTTYWQKVTSIDDINANYIIVNSQSGIENNCGGWALGTGGKNDLLTMDPEMTLCPGTDNIYTTTLGNEYWWQFSDTGNSSTQTNVKYPTSGIRLRDKDVVPIGTATTNTLAYSNGYWTISRSKSGNTYYLRYNKNKNTIYSSTDTNNPERRQTIIYKQVSAPAVSNETIKTGTGSNTVYTVNVYGIECDANGTATGTTTLLGTAIVNSSVSSSSPIVPETLFNTFKNTNAALSNSTYRSAYFGTATVKDKENVTALYRHNNDGTRYLGIKYNNGSNTTNQYLSNSDIKGLYIEYTKTNEIPDPPMYYQRVSSIDANADYYLIVSVDGNYALKTGNSPYCSQVELAPVKGNPGYFEVSGVVNTMKWKFGTSDGSGSSSSVYSQSDNNIALRLGSSNFYGSSTNLSRTYNATNGTWTLANSSYYLINDNGEFKRSNSDSFRRDLLILKPVDGQLVIPEDVVGGTTDDDGNVRKPSYPEYVEPSEAKTGSENYTGSSGITMSYASDAATSDLENHFIGPDGNSEDAKANDGKVLTDKSVVYGHDDYNAFSSYADGTFGVTLSALGQDYLLTEQDRIATPMDVVFVLDVSGSMGKPADGKSGDTRRDAVVSAVNSAMNKIYANNPENRVGIALYSSGSWTLLDMDRYYVGDSPDYENSEYEFISVDTEFVKTTDYSKIITVSGLKNSKGLSVPQKEWNINTEQAHGTYTQSGIARGYEIFKNVSDTTYTATIGTGNNARTYTVNRQPVFILLSDGDPTHCTNNYTDVLNGPAYGSGVYTNDNNKGIHGYYTILSANYYKSMAGIHYNTPAKFFTVGMGINETGIEDLSGSSYTGDHYKRAVLNPTSENISALNNNNAKNHEETSDTLSKLLGNSFNDSCVTVGTSTAYPSIGRTSANVPVINNPYTNYSYADGSYFGDITADQLSSIFNSILETSKKVKNYGFILVQPSSVEIEDPIGDGMEVKNLGQIGAIKLNYGGKTYDATNVSISGNVTRYIFDYLYKSTDGSDSNADLNRIIVTVTTDAEGHQTVKMQVPDDVLPTYTPNIGNDLWYYEALPVRLIYQVGLTSEAKTEINGLGIGGTLEYYTNRWENSVAADSVFCQTADNPYYSETDRSYSYNKEANATGTSETYFESVQTDSSLITALGNNGKLVFTKAGAPETEDSAPYHDKWIDSFRDNADNPDTDLDNKAREGKLTDGTSIEDLYRLYLNVGPETAYNALDVMIIFDASSSMCGDYARDRGGGADGFDAIDIKGNLNWRAWALDTMLNGQDGSMPLPIKDSTDWRKIAESDNYKVHQYELRNNGLISKIASLNPDNKIAVASFYKDATLLKQWTSARNISAIEYTNQHGTNYVAGLRQAKAFLEGANDDNQKIMIFISDGRPTYHYPADANGKYLAGNTGSYTGDGSETDREANIAKTAINEFKELYSKEIASGELAIYTIGVGTWDMDLLNTLSTNGSAYQSTNFGEILNNLDDKITRGVGRYSNLKITDKLSDYVDFYSADMDVVVQVIPDSNTTGRGTILYENGVLTDVGKNYIKTNGVQVDLKNKTISVEFLDTYEEEGGYRYSVSFNVKTTQKAYDDYAANGYSDSEHTLIIGDPNTDYIYNNNQTSSGKPGFFSNAEATLEYTQTHAGQIPVTHEEPYDDPVIQVAAKDIKIRKTDMSGKILTGSAEFEVYEDAELTKLHGTYTTVRGEAMITALSPGKTYYLVETKAPDGYNLLPGPKEFAVNREGKIGKYTETGFVEYTQSANDEYLRVDNSSGAYVLLVKNSNGYTLPETGGMGTTIFYICGSVLALGALLLIYEKRRTKFLY